MCLLLFYHTRSCLDTCCVVMALCSNQTEPTWREWRCIRHAFMSANLCAGLCLLSPHVSAVHRRRRTKICYVVPVRRVCENLAIFTRRATTWGHPSSSSSTAASSKPLQRTTHTGRRATPNVHYEPAIYVLENKRVEKHSMESGNQYDLHKSAKHTRRYA